jgi:hypothetical protein
MEIDDLLRDAFVSEWNRLSTRSITSYLPTVKSNFAITKVKDSLNEGIDSSRDKLTLERYHRQNLADLAKTYAQTLYRISDSGVNLNETTIRQAKAVMKSRGVCDSYPC